MMRNRNLILLRSNLLINYRGLSIISGPKEAEEPNPGGPYGCVVIGITKRRTFGQVDVQIRDWQENRDEDVG